MHTFFQNREQAGKLLAQALESYRDKDVVVLGLPRGGIPVAAEIAKALKAPLDCAFAHKIGHPLQEEYAIAAIGESGEVIENEEELRLVDKKWLEEEKEKTLLLMKRRRKLYLGDRKKQDLIDKIVILVDDGVATGLTMFAAILEMKKCHLKKLVIAVPVVPKETADKMRKQVGDFIALQVEPFGSFFGSVGAYYEDFPQVTDDEVIQLMQENKGSG